MDIDFEIQNLSWDNSIELQNRSILNLLLINEKDIHKLLQPNGKSCWGNAAIALNKIGYPKIKRIIPGLLKWLQDMNWPGADIVMETLKSIINEDLISHVENALIDANNDNDTIWITSLKDLIISKNIILNEELMKIIDRAEW